MLVSVWCGLRTLYAALSSPSESRVVVDWILPIVVIILKLSVNIKIAGNLDFTNKRAGSE